MLEDGEWSRAAMYVAASVGLSLVATFLGFIAARAVLGASGRLTGVNLPQGSRGGLMHGLTGERTLMRIHIGERDKYKGRPLYEAIVHLLRERGFAGATVFRGIMGFGATAGIHTEKVLRLSTDLPLVVETSRTRRRSRRSCPELDEMIGGGLITLERANVVIYRSDSPAPSRQSIADTHSPT